MNLDILCEQTVAIAKQAGEFIRKERNQFNSNSIEVKGLHNFVSYVDKGSEQLIVDGLRKILPQAGFIAEEGTGTPNQSGLNWVIDPLDGTTNFIHSLPPFAVSIALMENNKLLLGVIYEVGLNECFWATATGNAYMDGKRISASDKAKISDSLIATGFPYYDYDRIKPFFGTMEHFMRHSHGLRRLGSAATDLAYVACGRFEAFYEYSLQPWDVAAGALIAERAGGVVTDFSGGSNHIFGKEIVAANSNVYKDFQEIIANFMLK